MPDETETNSLNDLIIIEKPPLADYLGDYTHEHPSFANQLEKEIKLAGITSELFPFAADLYAGSGSVAEILARMGWDEEKITCVDKARPEKPLVSSRFLFWDLGILSSCILGGLRLPPQVEKYREKFDLVLVVQAHTDTHCMVCLGNFFLRPGGVLFPDFKDLNDQKKWEPFEGSHLFFRKKY